MPIGDALIISRRLLYFQLMAIEGITIISLNIPILEYNSDYLSIPSILLVPDPKISDNLMCISMKEVYFFINHLINTHFSENHPLLFNFRTRALQKYYNKNVGLESKLRMGKINQRKQELNKIRKNSYKSMGNEQLYIQLKVRNLELIGRAREERLAIDCVKEMDAAVVDTNRLKIDHKFGLIKCSSSLEAIPYEQYDVYSLIK